MAKRLCEDVADLEEGYNDGIVCISRYKAENERLLQKLQQAKSEAIKEFAERLKEKICCEDDCGYHCFDCCYECKDYVPVVDKLVKEMTEG